MKNHSSRLPAALAALTALALVVTTGHALWRLRQAAELAHESESLQVVPPAFTASLLIVGDSTGVGTGASSPEHSLAGLIAADHPHLRIVNRAEDGACFADVVNQLEQNLQDGRRFDAILLLAGGNDVIRLTNQEVLARQVERAAQLARRQARLVIIMPCGNVGNAPFFFPPLSWWMTGRSKMLHNLVRQAAAENGALYVSLYEDKADDPFAQRPGALNASDGLHPSDAGYQLWYDELNAQAAMGRRLAALRWATH